MNKRKFAHSWGRKLFFGVSWPISLIVGSIYLSSFIVPKGALDWTYFVLTYVGHLGLLNALVYFFLFAPIVSIMPSYYSTRLWSLTLILALNSFIAIDGVIFAQYYTHIYNYLWPIFLTNKEYVFTSFISQVIFGAALFAVGLYIWIRGEVHWRYMQARFSNPIKNWYLFLIIFFIGLSKIFLYFTDVNPRLGSILPLDYNQGFISEVNKTNSQKFLDPFSDMKCSPNEKSNLILLLVNEFNPDDLNAESMPHMTHFEKHVDSFSRHVNVNENIKESEFSLAYGLPGSYMDAASQTPSAFLKEATKNNYNIITTNPTDLNFKEIILSSRETSKPFVLTVKANMQEADTLIFEMVLDLQKKNLLDKTHIVVTGLNSKPGLIPFLYAAPEGDPGAVENVTSHYDILPFFMKSVWNCKRMPKILGVQRDWYLVSHPVGYKIYDLSQGGSFTYDGKSLNVVEKPRQELIFESLKIMNQFFKP